ncbi:unnamed protein product [Caenorhabditis auriculariae]|uniref:Ubiquitin carboxyl-terminal hydrolase 7 n=1 Tax=Caenorhabditis auriculariae TaxID=2777116 RepID=A0A8S1HAA8_9PELO|nr:unnamed protein product [Caenorhabditis auriculariae]
MRPYFLKNEARKRPLSDEETTTVGPLEINSEPDMCETEEPAEVLPVNETERNETNLVSPLAKRPKPDINEKQKNATVSFGNGFINDATDPSKWREAQQIQKDHEFALSVSVNWNAENRTIARVRRSGNMSNFQRARLDVVEVSSVSESRTHSVVTNEDMAKIKSDLMIPSLATEHQEESQNEASLGADSETALDLSVGNVDGNTTLTERSPNEDGTFYEMVDQEIVADSLEPMNVIPMENVVSEMPDDPQPAAELDEDQMDPTTRQILSDEVLARQLQAQINGKYRGADFHGAPVEQFAEINIQPSGYFDEELAIKINNEVNSNGRKPLLSRPVATYPDVNSTLRIVTKFNTEDNDFSENDLTTAEYEGKGYDSDMSQSYTPGNSQSVTPVMSPRSEESTYVNGCLYSENQSAFTPFEKSEVTKANDEDSQNVSSTTTTLMDGEQIFREKKHPRQNLLDSAFSDPSNEEYVPTCVTKTPEELEKAISLYNSNASRSRNLAISADSLAVNPKAERQSRARFRDGEHSRRYDSTKLSKKAAHKTCAAGERDNVNHGSYNFNNENTIPSEPMDIQQDENQRPPSRNTAPDIMMEIDDDMDDAAVDRYAPDGILRLDIDGFSEFLNAPPENCQRLSKPQYVRGLPWKILAMPRALQNARNTFPKQEKALGFFLQCNGDADTNNWSCVANATLRVINQHGGEDHVRKITHPFNYKENDWGYSSFLTFAQLSNPDLGYIKDDTIKLEIHVSADAPHGVQWDSKKHAGFIGLKNQGATCYMNSILQALYFTAALRKAVFEMPVTDEPIDQNVGLAMQRVFYELLHSDRPVGTKKLTKSFGWDTVETFMQHDVQELCRVLLDNLESKMKGTSVENVIPKLIGGKMRTIIRCLNVLYESGRTEAFYDLQLNIKGKKTIYDSLRDYTAVERLDGDNKYDAGEHGLQPAEKYTKFAELPPVLHFQLMRFQYEGTEQKINDRFEYPEELDLTEFSDGIHPDECVYNLQSVLVHSGDFHGGHYVVFINTNLHNSAINGARPKWCKFDDDVVSRASVREAVMANYGGEDNDAPGRAFTNAYMLVYVKKLAIAEVVPLPSKDEIPQHLVQIFETEKNDENRRKREKMEAHLFTELSIVTPELLQLNSNFELVEPKVIEERAPREKFSKSMLIPEFYKQLRKRLFFEPQLMQARNEELNFRVWKFTETPVKRSDIDAVVTQCRPNVLLNIQEAEKTIESVFETDRHIVYIEYPLMPNNNKPYDDANDILVFLKAYDFDRKKIFNLGHTVLKYRKTICDYHDHFCKMAGWSTKTLLHYYEEVTVDYIRFIEHEDIALCAESCLHEFKDGLIIIIEDGEKTNSKDNAKTFLQNVYDTIPVDIEMNNDGVSNFHEPAEHIISTIKLTWPVRALADFIGSEIRCDSNRIMIFHGGYGDRTNQRYVTLEQYRLVGYTIRHFLDLHGQNFHDPRKMKRYRIYYALLPFNLEEIDRRKQLKIQAMDERMNISEMTVWPERGGRVYHILEEARRDFHFSHNGTGKLRLLYVGQSSSSLRVFNLFSEDASADEVHQKLLNSSMYTVRVEEVPRDQLVVGPNEYLAPVSHYDRDPNKMFGVPFLFKVSNEEPLTSVRDRLREVLDVPEREFEKYKFALVAQARVVRYLDMNSDGLVNLAELGYQPGRSPMVAVAAIPYLGLEHVNKRGSRNAHAAEKAIRIHN